MSFFNPQVSFPLNFATPFSVMAHNSSESFQLKQYMLWTKRAHQCTIFRILGALIMKVHPIPHVFLKPQGQGFSNFASLFSVMTDNSSVSFQLKPQILWTKITHWSEVFGLLSCWVKIQQILHVIFETISQYFFKLSSLLNAMGVKSSVLFQLKLYSIFTKGAHHSTKFQTFDCSGDISPIFFFDRLLMEELCLMILKSGAKFEEKLIFCYKTDKNLVNFDPSTKKSKKSALCLVPFVQNIQRLI